MKNYKPSHPNNIVHPKNRNYYYYIICIIKCVCHERFAPVGHRAE